MTAFLLDHWPETVVFIVAAAYFWPRAWHDYQMGRHARRVSRQLDALKAKPRDQWTASDHEQMEAICQEYVKR